MAKLPDETVLGGAPSLRSGRPVPDMTAGATAMGKAVAAGADALGEGIARLGRGLQAREDDAAALQVAQANSQWLTKRIELDQRYDEDTDHATRRQRYSDELTAITNEARATITSPRYQQRFDARTGPLAAAAIAGQEDKARTQYNQAEIAHAGEMGVTLSNKAVETDNDDDRHALVDAYAAQVNGLVARNIVTPEQGRQMQQRFALSVLQGRALSAANSNDPDRIERTLNEIRAQPNTPGAIVSRIDSIEGTGRNPRSSASGTGQFIDATWLAVIKKHRPDLAQGKSDAEILELRADKNLGREMIGRYAEDNNALLKKQGIEITPGRTYLAHFLGPAGAAAVIKAEPGKPVQDVLAAAVGADKARQMVQANPTILLGKQTGTVVAWAERKMGGAAQGSVYQILPPEQRETLIAKLDGALHVRRSGDTAAFNVRVADSQAEALRVGQVSNEIPRGDFIGQFGHEEGTRRHAAYQGNLQLARDLATIADMSPEQAGELLARYEPQQGTPGYADALKRRETLVKAFNALARERNEDPGGFAAAQLPAVSKAYSDFTTIVGSATSTPQQRQTAARVYADITLAEQGRVGIAERDRRIVPKAYVDDLADRLTRPEASGGPANVAQRIEAEAALWGDKWPLVYRDLQAKAAPIVRVIGSGVTPFAARVLVETNNIPTGKILDDQSEVRVNALRKEVATAFAPLKQSLAGSENEQSIFNDFQAMGEKLAAHYVRGGKTDTDAAAAAFQELIAHKYEFVPNAVGGGLFGGAPLYRVPKDAGVPKETIAAGAEQARRVLDQFDLTLPLDDIGGVSAGNRKAAAAATYRRDAIWVTAPGDAGLMLVYKDQAVRRADGRPLIITWDGLEALAKSDPVNQPAVPGGGSVIGELFR
jgi:hypothetical protein